MWFLSVHQMHKNSLMGHSMFWVSKFVSNYNYQEMTEKGKSTHHLNNQMTVSNASCKIRNRQKQITLSGLKIN